MRLEAGQTPGLFDENGSVAFSRPVYRLTVTTQKKRKRRSASGTYFVYYELLSTSQREKPHTLRVLSELHAASAPLTNWLDTDDNVEDAEV